MENKFYENLKAARIEAKMTQKEVAERANIAKSTYSQYESGKREPSIEMIKRLSNVLGVKADKLLGLPPVDFEIYITPKDKILVESYHRLNEDGRRRLEQYAAELADIEKYKRS